MSGFRQAHEQQIRNKQTMMKTFRYLGWTFIGIGALLCLTIIGIPVGLLLIAAGFAIKVFVPKLLGQQIDAALAAQADEVEIREHQLRQVRETNARQD